MAIENLDQYANALGNNSSRIILDKASQSAQVAGGLCSLWRATGQPAQGAVPTTPAVLTNLTTGAIGFSQQVAPAKSYIGNLSSTSSNSAMTLEIHDRLAHNGGLVLNVTTAQTIAGLDLVSLGVDQDRIGDIDYSDVQWWLEVYTAGGATASNATINVTFDDNSTGNLNVQAVGGTLGAGRLLPLTPLKTTAQQSLFIRGINSVTLSASTGTAGNFGFTATRFRTDLFMPIANAKFKSDLFDGGFPNVPNGSCLFPVLLCSTTTSGTLRGTGKIVHG